MTPTPTQDSYGRASLEAQDHSSGGQREAGERQPIATAPRDGRLIWLFRDGQPPRIGCYRKTHDMMFPWRVFEPQIDMPTEFCCNGWIDHPVGGPSEWSAIAAPLPPDPATPPEGGETLADIQKPTYLRDVAAEVDAALSASQTPAPAAGQGALAEIAAERRRQVEAEGWTSAHDDEHSRGELARAAAAYARHAGSDEDTRQVNSGFCPEDLWPFTTHWRPSTRRRDLIKAGALIAAEIERLDRAAPRAPETQTAPAERGGQ